MPTTVLDLPCDVCGDVRAFAQPVCDGVADDDCPEWFCLSCATAILIDPPYPDAAPGQTRLTAA